MKIMVVAPIVAKHERAVEFNLELMQLGEKRKHTVFYLSELAKKVREKLTLEYAYTAYSAKTEPFLPVEVKSADPIRLVRVWINKERFVELAETFGVKAPDVPTRSVSCIYYRVGKVVVKADNVGLNLLKVNVEVSDEEWNMIKEGKIDPKLKAA